MGNPYLLNVCILLILHIIHLIGLDGFRRRGKKLLKSVVLAVAGEPTILGEVHLNDQVEIALGLASLQGHAFAGNLEHIARADNLAAGVVDVDASAVQVLHNNAREAAKGLSQRDVEVCREIVADAGEVVVGLLDKVEDEVAGGLVRELVGLALQHDPLALHGAARDVEFQGLGLLDGALPLALLAAVLLLDVHTGPLAVVAADGLSSNKTGPNLTESLLKTSSSAALALVGLRLLLILCAAALALAANDLLLGGELDSLALVELFQGDLVGLFLVRTTSWPAGATARHAAAHVHAEHLGEDVVQVDTSGTSRPASRGIKGGHAMGVVEMALLLVHENLVCLPDGFELGFGLDPLVLGDLVGVILPRQLG